MSKQQSYYVCLTADAHAAINVKVASKVEMQKAKRLFSNLVSKCQVSAKNSSTPQEFFKELKANMEKFSEFTDFFDTTAVSMATAITQMRFHTVLVDNWDKQYAKIVCTQEGKEGMTYDLPPPSMVVHLKSKKAAKKSGSMMSGRYNSAGTVDVSYGFIDEDGVQLEKLKKQVPEDAIKGAINTMMEDIEKLHRKSIDKVLVDCGFEPRVEEEIAEDGAVMTVKELGTSTGGKFTASKKMYDLIDKMNIKASDNFDDILKKLMDNPETRDIILEDFRRWRGKKEGIDDWQQSYVEEYERLMPKPGEFVAEA